MLHNAVALLPDIVLGLMLLVVLMVYIRLALRIVEILRDLHSRPAAPTARQSLQRRLALGEITLKEYRQRLHAVKGDPRSVTRLWLAMLGAVLLLAAIALVVLRWQAAGFPPWLLVLGLLAIVGLPGSLWLVIGRYIPTRRVPRICRAGLWLIAVGLLGTWLASSLDLVTTRLTLPTPATFPSAPSHGLHSVRLPIAVGDSIRLLFPRLVVGRALRVGDTGPTLYELWLKRPHRRTYTLQVTYAGGVVQVQNQGFNTDFSPRPGPLRSLRQIAASYRFPQKVYGPVVFPGYVLYIAPKQGYYWAIDRKSDFSTEGQF